MDNLLLLTSQTSHKACISCLSVSCCWRLGCLRCVLSSCTRERCNTDTRKVLPIESSGQFQCLASKIVFWWSRFRIHCCWSQKKMIFVAFSFIASVMTYLGEERTATIRFFCHEWWSLVSVTEAWARYIYYNNQGFSSGGQLMLASQIPVWPWYPGQLASCLLCQTQNFMMVLVSIYFRMENAFSQEIFVFMEYALSDIWLAQSHLYN